ncbi:hypothetical protein C8R45DRAFT_948401 [Mycena sanguinolenta]|nr:hypothetical protein C8R45DRAFT_948401 [Mycena sanguinolenta]
MNEMQRDDVVCGVRSKNGSKNKGKQKTDAEMNLRETYLRCSAEKAPDGGEFKRAHLKTGRYAVTNRKMPPPSTSARKKREAQKTGTDSEQRKKKEAARPKLEESKSRKKEATRDESCGAKSQSEVRVNALGLTRPVGTGKLGTNLVVSPIETCIHAAWVSHIKDSIQSRRKQLERGKKVKAREPSKDRGSCQMESGKPLQKKRDLKIIGQLSERLFEAACTTKAKAPKADREQRPSKEAVKWKAK